MSKAHSGRCHRPGLLSELVLAQGHQCAYCQRRFGWPVVKRGGKSKWPKKKTLVPVLEHIIPFAASKIQPESNFVAACQICNGFKSDKRFETFLDTCRYLVKRWQRSGWKDEIEGPHEPRSDSMPELPRDSQTEKEVAEVLQPEMPNGTFLANTRNCEAERCFQYSEHRRKRSDYRARKQWLTPAAIEWAKRYAENHSLKIIPSK